MESRNILILPLPLLWYLYDFLFDQVENQRATPIICPGKLDLLAEMIRGIFTAMFQALIRSGYRMMSTPLMSQPFWYFFFLMTFWNRRFHRIVVENDLRRYVSCRQYLWIPLPTIVLIVFSSFHPPFNPWALWLRMRHSCGQISMGLDCTLEYDSLRRLVALVSPSWSSIGSELEDCFYRLWVASMDWWQTKETMVNPSLFLQ